MKRIRITKIFDRCFRLASFFLLTALTSSVYSAEAPDSVPPTPKAVTEKPVEPSTSGKLIFNFQNADLEAVIKSVSRLTGRNFLLDPRVKGKVTIISTTPVSRSSAYQIFLSALKAQGFTAVSGAGGIVKIIPVGEGKQATTSISTKIPAGGDQMVTHIVAIENGAATQLVPLVRPLMAPTSQLSAYSPANSLIITDYAQNIRRILRIISKIDQPLNVEVTVIPIKHASALDLSDLISRTMSAQPGGPGAKVANKVQGLAIVPDPRTNSLLVRSNNPGRLKQLLSLIKKLDVVAVKGGNTHVVYLRNSDAKKLAEILRGLLNAEPGRSSGRKAGKGAPNSLIQADEETNSLIISATDAVYNNLRAVIEKLDIRRAQVYVEALIVEVTSDKASELGFQWATAIESGGNLIGIGTNFTQAGGATLGSIAANPIGLASAAGLSVAMLGPEIVIGTQTVRSIAGLAHALEESTNANILSTPNLLTLDNTEAKIVVGQNVPFVTGSYAATGGAATANPFQTIERRDVGLTLKIKPQISEGGLVKLVIFQEVSSVLPTTTSGAADLITNKRSLETTVTVDSGHTIVLGGLIEDKIQSVTQRIKWLGSIPILGALFRYKKKTKVKTNLMIFLKPTILYNADDSYRLSADRYRYLMGRNKKTSKQRIEILETFKPIKPEPEKKENDPQPEKEALGPSHLTNEEPVTNN